MKEEFNLIIKKNEERICILLSTSECCVNPALPVSLCHSSLDTVSFRVGGMFFGVEPKNKMIYIVPLDKGKKWCIYHKKGVTQIKMTCFDGSFEYRYDGDEFEMKNKSLSLRRKGPILLDNEFVIYATLSTSR